MRTFFRSGYAVRQTAPARRAQLLAAFERSGMTAASFARQYHINYTTFCGWRERQAKAKASPDFVQVELPTPPAGLVIELGPQARTRVSSVEEIALAVQLIQKLNAASAC